MFRERLIVDESLESASEGFRVRARMPWYRGLPMSCIAEASLTVDGTEISPADIVVEIDGTRLPVADLVGAWDKQWYVLDDAVLEVGRALPDGGPSGEHEVTLALGLRIPYLPVNDVPLVIVERCTKQMNAKAVTA